MLLNLICTVWKDWIFVYDVNESCKLNCTIFYQSMCLCIIFGCQYLCLPFAKEIILEPQTFGSLLEKGLSEATDKVPNTRKKAKSNMTVIHVTVKLTLIKIYDTQHR